MYNSSRTHYQNWKQQFQKHSNNFLKITVHVQRFAHTKPTWKYVLCRKFEIVIRSWQNSAAMLRRALIASLFTNNQVGHEGCISMGTSSEVDGVYMSKYWVGHFVATEIWTWLNNVNDVLKQMYSNYCQKHCCTTFSNAMHILYLAKCTCSCKPSISDTCQL